MSFPDSYTRMSNRFQLMLFFSDSIVFRRNRFTFSRHPLLFTVGFRSLCGQWPIIRFFLFAFNWCVGSYSFFWLIFWLIWINFNVFSLHLSGLLSVWSKLSYFDYALNADCCPDSIVDSLIVRSFWYVSYTLTLRRHSSSLFYIVLNLILLSVFSTYVLDSPERWWWSLSGCSRSESLSLFVAYWLV